MPFCTKCGTQYSEGTNFCPGCSMKVGGYDGAAGSGGSNGGNRGNGSGNGFEESFRKINDTTDFTNEFDPADIERNKGMALISYIWLLFLIPMLAARDSRYASFHANQGLVLFLAEIICGIAVGVVSGIFGFIGFGLISWLINSAFSIVVLALIILGIYNAATGRAKELPFIGKYRLYK